MPASSAPRPAPADAGAPEPDLWRQLLGAGGRDAVTLEEVVEQTVRGALRAVASLPPEQRPASVTLTLFSFVVPAPPPRP